MTSLRPTLCAGPRLDGRGVLRLPVGAVHGVFPMTCSPRYLYPWIAGRGTNMRSSQNRKLLSGLLAIVVAAALLAVYVLYFKSRHELPNEPPGSPAQSSVRP